MTHLPKELIKEAMALPGVSENHIDWNTFLPREYLRYLEHLINHTRQHLTTAAMARYVLNTCDAADASKVLFLSENIRPDYMRCLLLHGFKELLGENCVDYYKVPHLYDTYPIEDVPKLYGKGFTYSRHLPDHDINRDQDAIIQAIADREYDLVVYGSIHRGYPLYGHVVTAYDSSEIAYICGEDDHVCQWRSLIQGNIFIREM